MSSRTKRAVLVGINYTNSDIPLKGCVNDVINMKKLLMSKYGYLESNIVLLTDDMILKPTRKNILVKFMELILSSNSDLYFHYCGHGSSVKDKSNDECDGNDEVLVPIDYKESGYIIDDELRTLVQFMSESCKITIVLDCCNSGTAMDLSYNLYERLGRNFLFQNPMYNRDLTRGTVLCMSGCLDDETSADAFINNQYQGAFTNALISTLDTTSSITLNELIKSIKKRLILGKIQQTPCLSSGKYEDIDAVFTL